jgi:hypothetical protein
MKLTNSNMKVWQIGGGSSERDYSAFFLNYGVGLIGDGGIWPGQYLKGRANSHIRQFAEDVKVGDIIVLRIGRSLVKCVGIVASDYMHCDVFEDVDGWELQHARRVRWHKLIDPYDFGKPVFGPRPSRFSGVDNIKVIDYARRVISSPPSDWQNQNLPDLPPQEPFLDPVPSEISSIVAEATDIVPRFWMPGKFGDWPTEDELVAHFTIPLLKALGWSTERIAVKWRRVDISLFDKLPRLPENCQLIIEAKRFDTGFDSALKQAKGYLKALGIERDILVTDGIRYRLYSITNNFQPKAYANLSRLKKSAMALFESIKRK